MFKKLTLTSVFLLSLFSIAVADIVSLEGNFVAGEADVVGHLNRDRIALTNGVNNVRGTYAGAVQSSGQIKAQTIGEENMADDANPRVRTYEGAACEFVQNGLLPVTTSGTLVGNVPSGVAYPLGYRISKTSSTAHTFTASMWTYVDLDKNGTFSYVQQTIGGTTPSVSPNSLRLARVSTDSSQIIDVQDLRKTSCATGPFSVIADSSGQATLDDLLKNGRPVTSSNDIGWVQGLRVSYDTATTFKVTKGSAYINGKYRSISQDISVTTSTANPLVGGSGIDTGAVGASKSYNVFAVADQDAVKSLSAVYSLGAAPTGITNYRKIGEIGTDATSLFTSKDLVSVTGIDEKQLVAAYVRFNGTNGGVTVDYSKGVSSVTYVNTGRYRVNWANTFVSGDRYVVAGSVGAGSAAPQNVHLVIDGSTTVPQGSSVGILISNTANSAVNDGEYIYVQATGEKNK